MYGTLQHVIILGYVLQENCVQNIPIIPRPYLLLLINIDRGRIRPLVRQKTKITKRPLYHLCYLAKVISLENKFHLYLINKDLITKMALNCLFVWANDF